MQRYAKVAPYLQSVTNGIDSVTNGLFTTNRMSFFNLKV